MKRTAIAFGLLALLASAPAFALTSESQSGANTQGASNFDDPDEHLNFGNGAGATFGVTGASSSGLSPCVASGDCTRSALH